MEVTERLTRQFVKGLKLYGLSREDIDRGGWKYCGGNEGRHLRYFKIACPGYDLPPLESHCVCGHRITENCYITNGPELMVLGNCCIKRFVPAKLSGRTCERCGEPHRNRKVNRCKECRKGVCDECGAQCNSTYKKCYSCYRSSDRNQVAEQFASLRAKADAADAARSS